MEQNKRLKFILTIIGLIFLMLFITVSHKIPYPFNIGIMVCLGVLIILLSVKFVYSIFNVNQPTPQIHPTDISGQKIFYISSYRTTLLSISMILLAVFFIYLFIQLFPDIIEEIYMQASVLLIIFMVLYVILFLASVYCLLLGTKLFIRRKKIVQLIINDDNIEFFPIYDFGTTTRSTNALSMFFRKKMRKVYFTDQLAIEKVSNKWQGDKIRVYVEGVGFYLPFLYDDINEVEMLYQIIKQRLIKNTQ
ncbi:hypothetical protein [Chryseobacterium paridis]|uniref:Uncharacterized protein n=1 Tax=Chryseobacterium paridis TaxID=2800328 RepID=A0ABS1FWD3_9FLAO|nr:hypothetical protein [Chryseobacterium paridis]MBK1896524.1 hypothetical protein [Chryseobacterium paridis]